MNYSLWTWTTLLFLSLLVGPVQAQDRFHFNPTNESAQTYGPPDWIQVECDDAATCPGWPTPWHALSPYIPHNLTNTCFDCSNKSRAECKAHQQSPIDLWRNVTATRDCRDRHRMHFQPGNCIFEEMTFSILPHVLRAHQPPSCGHAPNIDFSWGFPNPWILTHTDVVLPSLHSQDGRQYDGEIVLSHVYSEDKADKRIANVAIFLEKGTEEDRYDFLDLYMERWRQEHEKIVQDCCGGERRVQEDFEVHDRRLLGNSLPQQLLNYSHFSREFHPYDWYTRTRTHYYFRYEGSTTEPPCVEQVHWRVLKDPAIVAPSQIEQLQRLLVDRIDPGTCQPYTAARIESDGSVFVNRPLQKWRPSHLLVYCECTDWDPTGQVDRAFCELPAEERGVVIPPTNEPTGMPSLSPSQEPDPCVCPTERSRYLCQLFLLIHPSTPPVCH